MSRLNKLRNKAKEPSDEKAPVPLSEPTGKPLSRLERLKLGKTNAAKEIAREPVAETDSEELPKESEDSQTVETVQGGTKSHQPDKIDVIDNIAKPSRLAGIGITKVTPTPDRPMPVDEEIEEFQGMLITLEKMIDLKAPELRDGIKSVMIRITEKPHLEQYLYDNPAEMGIAIRAFRAQFRKKHKATSERKTKKAQKESEKQDFLDLLD